MELCLGEIALCGFKPIRTAKAEVGKSQEGSVVRHISNKTGRLIAQPANMEQGTASIPWLSFGIRPSTKRHLGNLNVMMDLSVAGGDYIAPTHVSKLGTQNNV
jgi:hypothetical protein